MLLLGLPLQVTAGELQRLAPAVSQAAPTVRSDFAASALHEMATAYADEASRARIDTGTHLARWADAVDSYANELWRIADSITDAASIEIRVGAGSDVEVIIDGTTVVISGPRPQLQLSFEQDILASFCAQQPCAALLAEFQPPHYAMAAPDSTIEWTFSEYSGPICGNDQGLEFQFLDTQNLAHKREACARVIAELEHLALEIRRHRAAGVRVDWDHLAIYASAPEPQQRVELNRDGDSLLMSVPALAAATRLFVLVKPWLAARASGKPLRQVVINADTLMAPLFPTL